MSHRAARTELGLGRGCSAPCIQKEAVRAEQIVPPRIRSNLRAMQNTWLVVLREAKAEFVQFCLPKKFPFLEHRGPGLQLIALYLQRLLLCHAALMAALANSCIKTM